ncbi:MAG: TonB-dependent receptor [Chitinophagaceae bacterium]
MKPILAFLFLFLSFITNAQKGIIEGWITDAESKTPIGGATINIGVNAADNSDLFGKFSFASVNAGQYEMIVSHIGYKTEIVPVEVKPALTSTVHINLHRSSLDLSEVRINSKRTSGLNTISAVDIKLRPVNTSQDILRIIPGLFTAQHAGGGKAEQLFLRGYDIDHGTDIAVTADGIPVNMVSHAHGQGYADLHFLIPETADKINFDKGPYNGAKGNLATAAYADFTTKDFLTENMIKAEAGQFNALRLAGLFKLYNKTTERTRQQFYVASEYAATEGYFDSPQDFHRLNIFGKFNAWTGNQSQLTILASAFDSKWNASGQVPDRAVRSGLISRFGSIDNTEGGNTSRINASVKYNRQWKNNWKTTDQLYFTHYRFNLFSNFTFFLNDPVNGDMINQKEHRNTWGYTTTAARSYFTGPNKSSTEFGAGFRQDDVNDIALDKATRTQFFSHLQLGDIKETNVFAWVVQEMDLGKKVSANASVRYDHFSFRYRDLLAGNTGFGRQSKGILSPKLNFSFSPNQKVKLYLNNGIGFHSNDTRVILNNQAGHILPKVYGTDLGIIIKPASRLILKTALWHLYSEQEFVYVGDEGIVEPAGKTRRMGIDLSARYQFCTWLFGDADLNLTRARAIGEPKGENYVPLAPSLTSVGGITVKSANGLSGSLRYRLIGERPANEDNSVKAQGYFLLDAVLSYRLRKFDFSLSGENLLNREWREAQFETTSRLKFETDAVTEIHYTPGTPRYIKGSISFYF